MIGLKRRRRVEGWTVEVSEYGPEADKISLRQRLAENSKLWIISLAAIILFTLFFVRHSNIIPSTSDSYPDRLKACDTFYDDAHKQFADNLKNDKSYGINFKSVSFVAPGDLQVVVPGDVSSDDVEYMASMTGAKAMHLLKDRITVSVYYRNASSSPDAVASYDPQKGGFIVKFRNVGQTAPEY